jgi:flagellar biosynthesis/type III secretory pathway chaperone
MSVAIEPRVQELTDLLADEERLYGELLQIGQQEQGAILGRDPAGLHALIAEKERVIEMLARVETERQSWLAGWAAVNGAAPNATLADVTRQLTPLEAARVASVREALLRRVRDVAEMNNSNSHLLNGALRIVDRSIEVFSRVGRDSGYQPSGEPSRGSRTIVLDQRV